LNQGEIGWEKVVLPQDEDHRHAGNIPLDVRLAEVNIRRWAIDRYSNLGTRFLRTGIPHSRPGS